MSISIELDKAVDYAQKIVVYNEGSISAYSAEEEQFGKIIIGWKDMLDGAHVMPAFGVSLNSQTLKVINSGLWVEFVYNSCYESNGMPFEKLLINVQKSYQGFNIIRYNADVGYDGRCFYYDLVGKDMSNFYNILLKL